ncbi:TPA: hypothetical protein ACIWM7_004430 [Salmonella enterica subsp. enterica serovar Enteritidis]
MSEKLIIPLVLTSPMPWGVKVEWKWPEGSHWFSKLEMQYLHSDGRLEKQVIEWPVTGKAIGGLKAGERLQIRLRPIDKNGAVREWTYGDWIEGVSSSNADEYLAVLPITAGSDMRSMTSFFAPKFKIENGEAFINNAFISETIHAAETLKPKTSNSNIDVGKILDDAWKSGRPCIGDAVNVLAQAMSSNNIAEQTLSAVLATILPSVSRNEAEEAAITTARAVRAAFNALGNDNASPR